MHKYVEDYNTKFQLLLALRDEISTLHRQNDIKKHKKMSEAEALVKQLKGMIGKMKSNVKTYFLTPGQLNEMKERLDNVEGSFVSFSGARTSVFDHGARKKDMRYEESDTSRGMDNSDMHSYQQETLERFDQRLDDLHETVGNIREVAEGIGNEFDRGEEIMEDADDNMNKANTKLAKSTERVKKTRRLTSGGLGLICCNSCLFLILVLIFITAVVIPSGWPRWLAALGKQ